jgi:hypothetical protein
MRRVCVFPHDIDFTVVLFLNKFVGKSRLVDAAVELLSDTYTLHGVVFVALPWLIWFRDKRGESRVRLLMGVLRPLSRCW